jgi:hypothetical protein
LISRAQDTLYVGAMDRLIRVSSASNLSATDCEMDSIYMEATNVANCVSKGKSRDYDCRNHIRFRISRLRPELKSFRRFNFRDF